MSYVPLDPQKITNGKVDMQLLQTLNNNFQTIESQGIIQVVQKHIPSASSYTGTTSRAGTEVTALRSGITTKVDNSKIRYELLMSYETHWENTFFFQRVVNGVVTEIGSGNPSGVRRYGFFNSDHGADVSTTPNQGFIKFTDSPNLPAGTHIEYRIRYYGSAAHVMRLNWCYSTGDVAHYELSASNVILTEIGV